MHREIRAIVEHANDEPGNSHLAQLHYSRLARLHWSLALGVTIISWGIIQALMMAIH
ncbi:MAG TPA: hypothetical protein VGS59_02755 [Candidatus Acidoferrales bacterium]|nr:hypothetical protein [Candidatus Acidoferrales bacterium]